MTWLAWNVVKGPLLKAAPWLGCALALLIGWHVTAVHYRSQGRAESAAVIASDRVAMQRGVDAIAALRGALNEKNAESKARAATYAASKAQDAHDMAEANARWERSENARAALARVAKGTTGCAIDPDTLNALEVL